MECVRKRRKPSEQIVEAPDSKNGACTPQGLDSISWRSGKSVGSVCGTLVVVEVPSAGSDQQIQRTMLITHVNSVFLVLFSFEQSVFQQHKSCTELAH